MLKFFVRTTLGRKLDKSYNQIKYELLIDTEHKPVESFVKQLIHISDYDAVLLEDDLILCKDFEKRIKEAIKSYKDKIINFFYAPGDYFKTYESSHFAFNQCTYYPKGISKIIAEKMLKIDKDYQYDILEHFALEKLKMSHIVYRPCLVQHLDFDSEIGNKFGYRRSKYFIDYLDELGIDYEEANSINNKVRLRVLMEKKFKKYEKERND